MFLELMCTNSRNGRTTVMESGVKNNPLSHQIASNVWAVAQHYLSNIHIISYDAIQSRNI